MHKSPFFPRYMPPIEPEAIRVRYAQSAENYIRMAKLKEEQEEMRRKIKEEEERRLKELPQRNYWTWAKKAAAKEAATHGIYSRLKKMQEKNKNDAMAKRFNNMKPTDPSKILILPNKGREYFGGKRTRKNKSKKRSKSRKN